MMIRRLIAAAALVLFAGTAFAQGSSLGWGKKPVFVVQGGVGGPTEIKVQAVGGVASDSSFRPFLFDNVFGYPYFLEGDKDRDFSQVMNLGISGVSLPWGVSYSSNSNQFLGRYVGQYSRGALNITYAHATAADSDSVCLAVYIYGTNSSTSANRMLWTPLVGVTIPDTCFDNSPTANRVTGQTDTATVAHCLSTIPSFYITRSQRNGLGGTFLGMGGATRVPFRRWPAGIFRWPSSAGIWLPLADNAGNTIPFAYITVVVQNVFPNATGNITNLEVNYWPRVW